MRPNVLVAGIVAVTALAVLTGCGSGGHGPSHTSHSVPVSHPATPTPAPPVSTATEDAAPAPVGVPAHPAHVVVVMLENHSFGEVVGAPAAPFLSGLARQGATFSDFVAITHPSEPNYLALFSGSTHGLTSDACPVSFDGPNLAASLRAAGLSFTGYAEGLPYSGFTGCSSGNYARKHCPWLDFGLPSSVSQSMSDFPAEFGRLPTVAFVVPDLQHDMHDGTVAEADAWLRSHLSGYAAWATGHDSLLIVTADEDDGSSGNRVPAVIYGAHVAPGRYTAHYTLYSLLRTIEDMYRLPPVGQSASAAPITGSWR